MLSEYYEIIKRRSQTFIEAIASKEGILCINKKDLQDLKHLQEITIKYHSDHIKHRQELFEERKKQVDRIFIDKKLAIMVIMDCRTTS